MKHTVVQHKNSEIPTVSGKRSPIIKKTFQPKKGTNIYTSIAARIMAMVNVLIMEIHVLRYG